MNITDEQREELRLLISYVDDLAEHRDRCDAIVDKYRVELEKALDGLFDAGNRLAEANRNLNEFITVITDERTQP
jgi:hypothetical protein